MVVARYFGGTKLGVSGLINAYKRATDDAIASNQIVEKVIKKHLAIRYGYTVTNRIIQMIQQYELDVLEQNFGESCYYQLGVRRSQWQEIKNKLEHMADVTILT